MNDSPRAWLSRAACLLSLLGAGVSFLLLTATVDSPLVGWSQSLCGMSSTGCGAVLHSRWAWIPPAGAAGVSDGRHIPVALVGFGYFAALTLWLGLLGRVGNRAGLGRLAPLIAVLLGTAASLFWLGVMALSLQEWCRACVAAHVLNFLVAACVLAAWRREPEKTEPGLSEETRSLMIRLAAASLGLALCLSGIAWGLTRIAALHEENARLAAISQDLAGEVGLEDWLDRSQARQSIPVRPDDPRIPTEDAAASTLVVFTDLQCFRCRGLDARLVSEIVPQFGGKLQVVYKHFPICSACNDELDLHPQACEAAWLAEAARLQGGSAAFFKLIDLVSEFRKTPWSESEVREIARKLKLDPERLIADWRGRESRERVAADVELARQLGVTATPALFLEGRELAAEVWTHPSFWRIAARAAGSRVDVSPAGSGSRRHLEASASSDRHAEPIPPLRVPLEIARALKIAPVVHASPVASGGRNISSAVTGDELLIQGPTADGRKFDSGEWRGTPFLVFFWSTESPASLAELPQILRVHSRYAGLGMRIVGVACNQDQRKMFQFLESNPLKWPTVLFPGQQGFENPVARGLHLTSVPGTFLVGPDARVLAAHLRGHAIEAAVAKALDFPPAGIEQSDDEFRELAAVIQWPEGVAVPEQVWRPEDE